jgi:hypothetical protein
MWYLTPEPGRIRVKLFGKPEGCLTLMKTLADPKCRQGIETRLAGLRPDTPRRWGKMSAPQMVCHLADGFRMYMGLRPVAHDLNLFMRTAVKWR